MKCPTNANGTVTKIGTSSVGTDLRPIKLVNGVPTAVSNDFVDTSSAQTITGEKDYRTSKLVSKETVQLYDDTPSSNRQFIPFNAQDSNSNWIAREEYWAYADGGVSLQTSLRKKISGTDRINTINQRILSDGRLYVTIPTRTYNAINTSDVVTIGTLQASTDVVHTSGNESVSGNKSFLSTMYIGSNSQYSARIDAYGETGSGNRKLNIIGVGDTFGVRPSNYRQYSFFSWSDENNRLVAGLRAIHHSDGTYSVQIMTLNSDGTEKYATLIKGDVIT